ncbi:MAG: ABC transporter ATP-binding protein/permease [Clostridia bacterium]|nr:ABC transporter ATP-binding protein/permease [Clostridia bacterium]
MLEVKNVTKVYKSKNGVDVHALDGVTLRFPTTGMVFLLGKSGSGKSTLLNVCGGLDAPTQGEIIVKGRSSQSFSQSDFDSYRNTYVGFIFQEYNILNEFSVEDNIALALELQGQPKNKEVIDALLNDVDLSGFAKRKPNTLSGGQKQRIAIARALVKSPEIIMADEPTGALDSNTGKQVLDTLKKLSKDKLVLVVSHDREFAEQYADRIIELKDGKVLSDVSKTELEKQSLTENVHSLGDVLCVKNGTGLDESDFEKIKAFLKQSDTDVIIANNTADVQKFKKVSHINEDGGKEVFRETDENGVEKRKYTPEESRFIRSKLPAKHAVKIGLSSLKNKPFRLLFTVLLCTVAFVMFGLLSTLSFYNSEATFRQTFQDIETSVAQVTKVYSVDVSWYYNGEKESTYQAVYDTRFTQADFEKMQQDFGKDVFGGVPVSMSLNVRATAAPYWVNRLSGLAYLPEENSLRGKITGNYPKNQNEIVLSTYMAQSLVNCKPYDAKGKSLELSNASELIGKALVIEGNTYTVVGLLDSGNLPERFESLKNTQEAPDLLMMDFNASLEDGLHLVGFVSYDRLEKVAQENKPYAEDRTSYQSVVAAIALTGGGESAFPEYANAHYMAYADLPEGTAYTPLVPGKTKPGDNEVVVCTSTFYSLVREAVSKAYSAAIEKDGMAPEKLEKLQTLTHELVNGGVYTYNKTNQKEELRVFTEAEKSQKIKQLISLLKQNGIALKLELKLFNMNDQMAIGESRKFDIVGISSYGGNQFSNDYILVSDATEETLWDEQKRTTEYYTEVSTLYKATDADVYGRIFLPFDGSQASIDHFWRLYKNQAFESDGSRVDLTGSVVEKLRLIDSTVHELSKVFLYVGLVLAVFAALLLSNFISVSISQKKREIGILRAVGARSLDVFKIFFSESFFITVVCVLLSAAGSMVICSLINAQLSAGIGASILVFGPASFAVLLAVSFVTAVLATFLPVYNAARKKPVESIRSI